MGAGEDEAGGEGKARPSLKAITADERRWSQQDFTSWEAALGCVAENAEEACGESSLDFLNSPTVGSQLPMRGEPVDLPIEKSIIAQCPPLTVLQS